MAALPSVSLAFNTLVLLQMFNVFNARPRIRALLRNLFRNRWLWLSVGASIVLQIIVIYAPFMQRAFSTVPLSLADWLLCGGVASSVLWLREFSKLVSRLNK